MQNDNKKNIWQFFTKKRQKFWMPNSDNCGKNVLREY